MNNAIRPRYRKKPCCLRPGGARLTGLNQLANPTMAGIAASASTAVSFDLWHGSEPVGINALGNLRLAHLQTLADDAIGRGGEFDGRHGRP